MKKYVADLYGHYNPVVEVEVERETESSVWIDGRKKAKRSTYLNYFDTYDEAKDRLLIRAKAEHSTALLLQDKAKRQLEFVNGL